MHVADFKMKHKSPKQASSTYKLVKSRQDEELDHTPDHPTYEEMIKVALDQSRSKGGVSKDWLLKRLVEKWKVREPYATNAIAKALKRMKKDKIVKRTPGGLFQRINGKPVGKQIGGKKLRKKRTREEASASISKSRKTVGFRNVQNIDTRRELNNLVHDGQINEWNSRQCELVGKTKSSSSKKNSGDKNLKRRAGVVSMYPPEVNSDEPQTSESESEEDAPPNYVNNPNFQRLQFRQQVHSSSEDDSEISRYNLGADWPIHAETERTDLATMKNNIRQILLDNNDIHGNPGMTQEEIVCAIVLELGHSGLSTLTHRKVRPQVEKALLHMKDCSEVIRCGFKNTYNLPEQDSKIVLKDKTMRKFIESNRMASSTPANLLMQAVKHFSSYTFAEVNRCFNNTIYHMNEPTDDDVSEEEDPIFNRNQSQQPVSDTKTGYKGGGDAVSCSQNDQNRLESDMTSEQLRLTCPCCSNELLITIRYNK